MGRRLSFSQKIKSGAQPSVHSVLGSLFSG